MSKVSRGLSFSRTNKAAVAVISAGQIRSTFHFGLSPFYYVEKENGILPSINDRTVELLHKEL